MLKRRIITRMTVSHSWFADVRKVATARAIVVCLSLFVPASPTLAASLNQAQLQQALQLTNSTVWVAAVKAESRAAHIEGAEVALPHPLGAQTLSIEKQESKKQPESKLLRVYQFHYELQQARLLVVDPDENRVIRIQQIASVHLPLNAAEIAYASQLLSQNNTILDTLREEQLKRGRVAFDDLSELDVKASIYEPLDAQHPCHRQRCVLLSLFDVTRTVFATEPVINLQTLQVTLMDGQ